MPNEHPPWLTQGEMDACRAIAADDQHREANGLPMFTRAKACIFHCQRLKMPKRFDPIPTETLMWIVEGPDFFFIFDEVQ